MLGASPLAVIVAFKVGESCGLAVLLHSLPQLKSTDSEPGFKEEAAACRFCCGKNGKALFMDPRAWLLDQPMVQKFRALAERSGESGIITAGSPFRFRAQR